jgi:CheY-like chemotaxis protein/two-component sensor histidine kinase
LLRLIDNAAQGAQRGVSLTRRMLAFARKQELRTETVRLPELVQGMTEMLQRTLGPTIAIETGLDAALPPVESDPNQLEMALLNLAVNSRDAMPGEGRIRITARREHVGAQSHGLAPGDYICLSVEDDGDGMDKETLKRATEPFFTTKGIGKGTGLGLSMVLGFAEQSGGTLVLNSRKGEGTVAEIWLPAAGAGTPSQPGNGDGPAWRAAHAALDILVVDDDSLVRASTEDMLEDLGHRVTGAASGAEALALMEKTRFDMVVSDHAMPHMTGAQLAQKIRHAYPGVKILLVSGYAELPGDAGQDVPRLAKPFNQDELGRAVTAAIGG